MAIEDSKKKKKKKKKGRDGWDRVEHIFLFCGVNWWYLVTFLWNKQVWESYLVSSW